MKLRFIGLDESTKLYFTGFRSLPASRLAFTNHTNTKRDRGKPPLAEAKATPYPTGEVQLQH